jgi:hypothetical protein
MTTCERHYSDTDWEAHSFCTSQWWRGWLEEGPANAKGQILIGHDIGLLQGQLPRSRTSPAPMCRPNLGILPVPQGCKTKFNSTSSFKRISFLYWFRSNIIQLQGHHLYNNMILWLSSCSCSTHKISVGEFCGSSQKKIILWKLSSTKNLVTIELSSL